MCLYKKFYLAALEQQAKIFAEAPNLAVLVTKRRPPQIVHLALVGHPSAAWCGMPLHPGSRNWSQVGPVDEFKRNTCPKCLELFAKVTGRRVGIITGARV
jgi:hypothetical protein